MGFNNSIAGGNGTLVRNQLQSANFVTGVSGWRLSKTGAFEANTGTFRGSISSGVAPGQRFVVNPGGGDIIQAYNASNQLVFEMTPNGDSIWSTWIGPTHTEDLEINGQGLFLFSRTDASEADYSFAPSSGVATQAIIFITAFNNSVISPFPYQLQLLAGSDDGSKKPTLVGTEQGISGTVTQSSVVGSNSLIFAGDFTGVTDAAGKVVVTHGAGFTPSKVFVQVHDTGAAPTFGDVDVMNGSINATTFQVFCTSFTGVTRTSASVSFYYFCIK